MQWQSPADDVQQLGAVLLVEDDGTVAEVVCELLAPIAAVHWATSVEQALGLLDALPWDVVVTDIELPGAGGLELLQRVTAALPHVATLVLSGHTSFEFAVEAMRGGADDYMTKPLDPQQLIAKVAELMVRTREQRARGRQVVLAIGAHPDDVEIGVGGILLRHAAVGDEVAILTLTDASVSEGGQTIATIKRTIDELGPTTIYTHTAHDLHQDHRNVHHATLVAARGVARVYCYQAPSTTVEFHPTRFVAIDDFVDGKLDVIRAYASQVAVRSHLDEELLRATARYWGRFAHARYVEPLEVVRESDVETALVDASAGVRS